MAVLLLVLLLLLQQQHQPFGYSGKSNEDLL